MEMSYLNFYFSSKVHRVCCIRIWISLCNEKCLKQELAHICAVPRRHLKCLWHGPDLSTIEYKACAVKHKT